jgi:hypothetical protein
MRCRCSWKHYGEQRHLDYWLGHSLPVFLILHDPDRNLTLWQKIERHLARVTDKGWIKLFRDDFLVHFQGWGEAARRIGVEVLNCTPGSALAEFPMRSIDDVLAEAAHVNHQHPDRHHAGTLAGPG